MKSSSQSHKKSVLLWTRREVDFLWIRKVGKRSIERSGVLKPTSIDVLGVEEAAST